jgi:hypothetical protein
MAPSLKGHVPMTVTLGPAALAAVSADLLVSEPDIRPADLVAVK